MIFAQNEWPEPMAKWTSINQSDAAEQMILANPIAFWSARGMFWMRTGAD